MQRYAMRELAFKLVYEIEVQKESEEDQLDIFIENNDILDEKVIDYLKGDMNKDVNISITDVIKLLRVYLELDNEEADTITIGDMNNSENITITDVIILLRQYLELE